MRRYEQIVILDSDLSEDERSPVFDKLKELIPQYKGFLIDIDEWGQRKLAYDIKKKPRGYYAQVNFCGFGDLVAEMERFFRIDDRILKYMTVLLDKEADVEAIKAEMVEKTARKAEAEAAAKAAEEEARQAAEKAAAAEAKAVTSPEAEPETEAAGAEETPTVQTAAATPEAEAATEESPAPEEESTEAAATPKE